MRTYRTIGEAWLAINQACLAEGRIYTIDRGSFEGHQRKQLDALAFVITRPETRPLGIEYKGTAISSDDGIQTYFADYLVNPQVAENETYCYSADTEILTDNGWKLFFNLDINEKVATLNPDTEEIIYQFPIDCHSFSYDGDMHLIQSRNIDLCVTPNHTLLYANNNGTTFYLSKIETALASGWRIRIKRDGKWYKDDVNTFILPSVIYGNSRYKGYGEARNIAMDKWLAFLGIWLAEGSLRTTDRSYTVVITQVNSDRHNIIFQMVKDIFPNAFSYREHILICDKQLHNYLIQFGKAADKHIPRDLLNNLSSRQLHILFDWLYLGDGHKLTRDGRVYGTISKRLADNVQEICLKIGFAANVTKRQDGGYNVNIATTDAFTRPHFKPKHNYSILAPRLQKVWCVSVPHFHTLYVRRNGKACWSGNTYAGRIAPYLATVARMLRETPHTNQAIIEMGRLEGMLLKDPPCLRLLSWKVTPSGLQLTSFWRSWDVYAALPVNLGGLQLLNEMMAEWADLKPGPQVCYSDGAHVYDYCWGLVDLPEQLRR